MYMCGNFFLKSIHIHWILCILCIRIYFGIVHIAPHQRNTKTIRKCEEVFNAAIRNTRLNKSSHMATCVKRIYLKTKFHLWWESTQNRSRALALIWNPAVLEKLIGCVKCLPQWHLRQLARGALHWSTLILSSNYIDWRTNCLCGSLQRPETLKAVAPFRPHWDLPSELLAALAGWQISQPLLLVTNTVVARGISPALMKLHGICSALHKPFPKEAMINPLSLSDLTAVLRDV